MIVWVLKGSESTEMIGFDKSMREVARLVEVNNEWTITSRSGDTYQMRGNGCPDPIDFMFRLISPVMPIGEADDIPYLRFRNDSTGECWEVWAVK